MIIGEVLDAISDYIGEHGKRPSKILVSHEFNERIVDEQEMVYPWTRPGRDRGQVCRFAGCDWYEDPSLSGCQFKLEA